MFVEELLQSGGGGVLVGTLDLDGDGVAALDAHAHQSHETGGVNGLAVLVNNGDGALASWPPWPACRRDVRECQRAL